MIDTTMLIPLLEQWWCTSTLPQHHVQMGGCLLSCLKVTLCFGGHHGNSTNQGGVFITGLHVHSAQTTQTVNTAHPYGV